MNATLTLSQVLPAIFAAPLIVAAIWDGMKYRIPNLLTVLLAASFVPAALLAPQPVDWAWHLGAAALVFGGGAACFAMGWLGGGDVKLAAAVALWLGPLTPVFLLAMAVAGGVVALVVLGVRRLVARLGGGRSTGAPLPRLLTAGEGVPYGLAIAAGGLVMAWRLPLVG
ncbi:Type IV prepilin peptidase TadV/CpaA [Caenispirillum salinarum AK4]|uniref:Type IV prepilin peptidase TadV/CpaA n=1 Tax=Caenispirillum salinarum AK4 TaxID=1238182 RepID=K9HDW9_9PROT|nr:prepilin peptidase [Caenispirillum salinarum]EKV28668.1 Type IV prepilin peptidase TadV/CpaA [Caenispirillum salinarum AK4]